MNRQLIYRILAGSLFLLFPFIMQAQVILKNWAIEDHSGEMQIMVSGDTLDITAPKGLTLWYNKRLTGDYEISYRIKMLMQGGKYDRLSDLNCFWAANDPQYPDDIFARSEWRNGVFKNYNTLKDKVRFLYDFPTKLDNRTQGIKEICFSEINFK